MSDVYCEKILTGELKVNVAKETKRVLAFHHTQPFWEKHIVLIPKKHLESLTFASAEDSEIVFELLTVAKEICADLERQLGGCRLSTNIGSYQSSKHLHFYIHAGRRLRSEDGTPIKTDL